ncbi:MAG: serine/threonine protein kinase [Deltaproteobacteria bacterium]|nr:MAG: serine/threonine protein kinase [Deltaproteobacteria bacterium]
MRGGAGRLAAIAAAACAAVHGAAAAQTVAVADLYAEPDLRDEAAAATLLVRSMLDVGGAVASRDALEVEARRAGLRGPALWIGDGDAPAVAAALGVRAVVIGAVDRDGIDLVARGRAVGPDGSTVAVFRARAPDGDVTALARGIATPIASALGLATHRYPAASVGQLRPFARAARALLAGDPAAAADALAGADLLAAARVAAATEIAARVANAEHLPVERRALAALAGARAAQIFAFARGADPVAVACRARAHLAALDADAAARELDAVARVRRPPPILRLARAELAHRRGDAAAAAAELAPLLGRAPYVPALPVVADLPPGALPAKVERAAVAAAESVRATRPRLAAALGLRAARAAAGRDLSRALALISVRELDAIEVDRLAPIVDRAREGGDAEALRLAAEIAMRRGDRDAALAAVRALLQRRPDDRVGARYLGRLLWAGGDRDGALAAYARAATGGDRAARAEWARALVAAGRAADADLDGDDSALALRARAARLAAAGDARGAATALATAAELDPADGALVEEAATAHRQAGADDEAAALEARRAWLRDDAGSAPAATAAEVDDGPAAAPAALADARAAALADALARMLAAFPALAERRVARIALVPLAGGGGPVYAPRRAVPERLRAALERAVAAPAFGAKVAPLAADPMREPLAAARLRELARSARADAILLYRARPRGRAAEIKLTLYEAATGDALDVVDRVEGAAADHLVVWNRTFVGALVAIGGLLALWLGLRALRGTGGVRVRLDLDPAADDAAYAIELSRRSKRPDVGDLADYVARMRRGGHKTGRLSATLAGALTEFPSVPAGTWWVHVLGGHTKGGQLRAVPPRASARVRVRRGKVADVRIDLVPPVTEYTFVVYDGDEPVRGASVRADRGPSATTGASGEAVLELPRGSHVVRIEAGGLRVERRIDVTDTKLHRVVVNLARERRLADVADGIELAPEPAGDIEILPTSQSAAPRVASGSSPAGLPDAARSPSAPALATGSDASPHAATAAVASGGLAMAGALGRYRRVAELGRGAMGVVYRARDAVLERDVALKIMTPQMRAHPVALQFFLQEAKALAQLNHPNIVTVYDQGQDGDEAFMVMEFVDGQTLEALLADRAPLPLSRALDIADQLCRGLAYAHARHVIHRDIKPANVFVARDGTVKIGDFGLARVVHELRIQRTEVRGTPLYMAPEQIHGVDIDHRADLYAAGCTIYELVAGRPPFIEGEVLYHHLHTEPAPPSQYNPDVPAALDQLLLRCLAKDKHARIARAEDICEALRPLRQRYG